MGGVFRLSMFRSSSFLFEVDHKGGDDAKEEDKYEQIKRNYNTFDEDYLDGEYVITQTARKIREASDAVEFITQLEMVSKKNSSCCFFVKKKHRHYEHHFEN